MAHLVEFITPEFFSQKKSATVTAGKSLGQEVTWPRGAPNSWMTCACDPPPLRGGATGYLTRSVRPTDEPCEPVGPSAAVTTAIIWRPLETPDRPPARRRRYCFCITSLSGCGRCPRARARRRNGTERNGPIGGEFTADERVGCAGGRRQMAAHPARRHQDFS